MPQGDAARQADYRKRRHLTGRQLVPAVGTRRRLQALAAAGWPLSVVSTELGFSPSRAGHLLTAPVIHRRNADLVRRLFDDWWDKRPRGSALSIARTLQRARAEGWAPAAAWDDIDDPAEKPRGVRRPTVYPVPRRGAGRAPDAAAVVRAVRGERVTLTWQERREAVAVLTGRGLSAAEIRDRLGVAERTVTRHRAATRRQEAAA